MEQKKLGFGFMRLPVLNKDTMAAIDKELLFQMVDVFMERGFTYFDTAYMYHMGQSEEAVREAVVKRYPRESFSVATKLPTMFLKAPKDQERIFCEQLERCGVDYFDCYLLHNLGAVNYQIAQKFGSFAFIEEKKKAGKIKKIGFSYHDNAELLDEILTEHPEVDFVQLQINYLDWENESIQSRKCYETAGKHHKPVIAMEPVKGGTLAKIPEEAARLFKEHHPTLSVSSWAIRFAASHEGVMMVLSGMSDMEQILDNTGYMRTFMPFTAEEYGIVERAVQVIHEAVAIECTSCGYCTEVCPKHIPIPQYFALYNVEKQSLNGGFSAQRVYYNNYAAAHGKASECIVCKQCEKHCPQHLAITKYLKAVAAAFES